jgi:hypothetical protein
LVLLVAQHIGHINLTKHLTANAKYQTDYPELYSGYITTAR